VHVRGVSIHGDRFPTRERYPFNLPIFHRTERVVFESPVTFFAGENGTGKSTLLEAIAHQCGIHIWRDTQRSRFELNPYEDSLRDHISVHWVDGPVPGSFFGSSVFQYFTQVLDQWAAADPGQLDYFGGRSLVTQSHGQSMMSYFRNRYRIKGLYLMDEPETALSPQTQLALLEILATMGHAGHAQFIVATHSPILLACPGAVIHAFDDPPIRPVSYEDTAHYRIYRAFMADPWGYLRSLGSGG
jgi:predicted ATPase